MNLTKYPKYKDSGIEWLGRIPEHWELKRGNWIFDYVRKIINRRHLQDREVLHYSIPSVQSSGEGLVENGNLIDSDKILLKGNELLISKLNPRKETIVLVKPNSKTIVCSTEFIPLIPVTCDKKFAFYLYLAHISKERICSCVQSVTKSHERARPDDVYKLWNIFPPLDEQEKIADYLDQKTAKIDELIKKNGTLIELLKEKRQAIISQAVTKGLDPNAKMKDSGIEWIGEIPKGWETKKLKYISEIVLGKMLQNEDSGGDHLKPYMRAQNIQWETIDVSDIKEMWLSKYEMRKYRLEKGGLLVSEGGEVGRTALWKNEIEECYIQNSVHKVTANSDLINNKYLLYLFETCGKKGFFESIINRVSIGHLTREKLKEIEIIHPPINNQNQIVAYLTKKTSQIDGLIGKKKAQNRQLKEYRQTLISNVVTGKVKVK